MGPLDESATMDEPWIDFDLSTLTYPQFIAFFFNRPVVGSHEESFELFSATHFGADGFCTSDPAIIVANVEAMCHDFTRLTKTYSHDQLDQGLWALFGSTGCFGRHLFDAAVDLKLRINCVETMYLPFRDVVAHHTGDVRNTFYWMWWDMILHLLDPEPREYGYGHATLTPDQQHMVDAIFHTVSRILALDHFGCQLSALHGLGHLYHPLAGQLLQSYLDERRGHLTVEDTRWIEACRENHIA